MPVNIVVGTNSYISVEDATNYFADRLYSDAWTNSAADDKAKALIMATKRIDRQKIRGIKAASDQTLEFPRAMYAYGDAFPQPVVGAHYGYGPGWIAESGVSQNVLDAVCEEAIALLAGGATANQRAELQAQGVKSFSIGKLSETFRTGAGGERLLSLEAKQLLQRYLSGGAVIV